MQMDYGVRAFKNEHCVQAAVGRALGTAQTRGWFGRALEGRSASNSGGAGGGSCGCGSARSGLACGTCTSELALVQHVHFDLHFFI